MKFSAFLLSAILHGAFMGAGLVLSLFGVLSTRPTPPSEPIYDMPLDVTLADTSSAPISKPKSAQSKQVDTEEVPEVKEAPPEDKGKVEEIQAPEEEKTPQESVPESQIKDSLKAEGEDIFKNMEKESSQANAPEQEDVLTSALESPAVKEAKAAKNQEIEKEREAAKKAMEEKKRAQRKKEDDIKKKKKIAAEKKKKEIRDNKKRDEYISRILAAVDPSEPESPKSKKTSRRQELNLLSTDNGGASETPVTDKDSTSDIGASTIGPLRANIWDRIRVLLEQRFRVPHTLRSKIPVKIEVYIEMNRDGRLKSYSLISSGSTTSHPLYRALLPYVHNALEPFKLEKLPLDLKYYDQWKAFYFVFENT